MMQEEQPLQVARCTKIINPGTDEAKYVINVKQIAKFVVGLGDKVRAAQQTSSPAAEVAAQAEASRQYAVKAANAA
jgi:ATP-dependent 26S proteasome regulatory subunit